MTALIFKSSRKGTSEDWRRPECVSAAMGDDYRSAKDTMIRLRRDIEDAFI